MASFLHPFQHCIVLLWLVWLNEFLLGAAVRSLQFPHEDCNAVSIIESKAKCRPYPAIEVMMDHITLKGKKLSTIKRLSPSHVMIHQCSGTSGKDSRVSSHYFTCTTSPINSLRARDQNLKQWHWDLFFWLLGVVVLIGIFKVLLRCERDSVLKLASLE